MVASSATTAATTETTATTETGIELSPATWSELFRGRRAAYTLILALGIGLHAIDVFIIATVMPAVVADIGGAAFYTWATMLYMVASIMGAASGGAVKAALDARYGYIAAALTFLAGSVGCAVAPNMALLLLARAVQGAGGGLIMAFAMMLVRELYPAEIRTRMLSAISAMWGIAALLGPTVGGVFSEIGWWRGAFWAGVPVIVLFTALAWRTLPDSRPEGGAPGFPLRRLALLATGVLSVGLSGQVAPLAARLALVAAAIVRVGQAFRLDGRAANRLFPSHPLSIGNRVGTAYWMLFLFSMTHAPIGVFLPLVVQVLHGGSALLAGYFNTVLALTWTAGALLSSGLRGRAVRVVIILGPLCVTGGVAGQALLVVEGPLLALAGCVALTGFGIGLCLAHIVNWTMSAASAGEEAVTASSITTVRAMGIAFGAALAGLVANAAGLGAGVSPATVAAAAAWVYGLSVIAPTAIAVLSFRLLWLHRERGVGAVAARQPGD